MSTEELGLSLGKSKYSVKRALKKLFRLYEDTLLEGFCVIQQSPIHCINKFGEVRRIRTRRVIVAHPGRKGYLLVCLQNKKSYAVHRLVALTFIHNPNPEVFTQVNHIDGNKLNNNHLNLEWVTNTQNREHAIALGLWDNIGKKVSILQKGENNSMSKLSNQQVLDIYKLLTSGHTVGSIAELYNVNSSNISQIRSGKSWSHLHSQYFAGTSID